MQQNNIINLREQAKNILLQEIAPNISVKDRKEAILKLNLTATTIYRYLNGDVRDIGTATKIIKFLRGRIKATNQAMIS